MANKSYSIEESLQELEIDIKDLTKEMEAKARQNVQVLAAQAHAMILAKAQSKLTSTRKIYTDALGLQKIASSGDNEVWAVTLNKNAGWIEDGNPNYNMLDGFLKSPKAKMGKNGKYLIIPFEHSKSANEQSETQSAISKYAKSILKEHGLDKTVTRDGKPILGKVASLKINGNQGALKVTGRDGKAISIGNDQPVSRFNRPLLNGLTVYQSEMRDKHGSVLKNKDGQSRIKKSILTFRIAAESQRGSGLWQKKAMPGLKAFEETERELDQIWEQMCKDLVK